MVISNWLDCGTITFGEPRTGEAVSRSDPETRMTVIRTPGRWCPSNNLRPIQEQGFSCPIELRTTLSGYRSLRLGCSLEELVGFGPEVGLGIIEANGNACQHAGSYYRRMHSLFQYARRMKEHLTRRFRSAQDLYVRASGRLFDGQRDILPDGLGKDSDGNGPAWSVATLIERGEQAARAVGLRNPASSDKIHYGLLEAAYRNPLRAEPEEVSHLVRMALFDWEACEGDLDRDLLDQVMKRFLIAVEQNNHRDTEDFREWCLGPKSSLVKQIAKQKKALGGRLDTQDVRRALLQIGWQSYSYMSHCIDAFLEAVRTALPDPLSAEEECVFRRIYESQPAYGDLPLCLLSERMGEVNRALLDVVNHPRQDEYVHVLHRLLWFYSTMAHERRLADRRSKNVCSAARVRRNPAATDDGQCPVQPGSGGTIDAPNGNGSLIRGAIQTEFIDNIHCPASAEQHLFARIADDIREARSIQCVGNCEDWEYHCEGESVEPVTIAMRCACGRVARTIDVSSEEFKKYAEDTLE